MAIAKINNESKCGTGEHIKNRPDLPSGELAVRGWRARLLVKTNSVERRAGYSQINHNK